MKQCENCGSYVSDAYYRVKCNNEGILCGCPECTVAGETLKDPEEESQSKVMRERLEEGEIG